MVSAIGGVGTMPVGIKTKAYLLILLVVLSLGCAKNKTTDAKDTDVPNETKESPLPIEGHQKKAPLAPPKLASVLYDLAVASDPETFAAKHDIFLLNNSVKVFITFIPNASESKRKKVLRVHDIQIEKEFDDLARALVPVDRLIPLSKEPVIKAIGLPKTFIKTNGKNDE